MKYLLLKIAKTVGMFITWLLFTVFILFFDGLSSGSSDIFLIVAMLLGMVLTFIVVGRFKLANRRNKKNYIDSNSFEKVGFVKEMLGIVKTKDYIFDVAGFMILVTPLIVYIAVTSEGHIMPRVYATICCILIPTVLYAILNLIVIFVVRKLWHKGY